MRHAFAYATAVVLVCTWTLGCRSVERSAPSVHADASRSIAHAPVALTAYQEPEPTATRLPALPTSDSQPDELPESDVLPEEVPLGEELTNPAAPPRTAPALSEVVASVRLHFPLVQEAVAGRQIAAGQALEAAGAFDRKLDLFSESQPLGFYENYRHSVDVKRDTLWGGQTFAGYRIGRGDFEPWYLERETNKGGEFKAGVLAPVIRDRDIDANRSLLWQAQLERGRIEPLVRAQVIQSVRDGAVAYWDWVAAAADFKVAEDVLSLAEDRAAFLRRQVELGEMAEIELVDNQRIIVSRQAKLTDARRKLEQAAYKLSLFLRTPTGQPLVLDSAIATGEFPTVEELQQVLDPNDIAFAVANRPELVEIQVIRQQLSIALRQAVNEMLPDVDAGVLVAQDVGEPTSAKRDKSELELEALLTLSVPLERRKALGKARQLRGKLAQTRAKLQFAEEKIIAEVQLARAALTAAAQRVGQTAESLELAQRMQTAEQRLYNEGQSTLINLNIREIQAAEAAAELIFARQQYFEARAEYRAALGMDGIPVEPVEEAIAQ